MPNNSNNRSGWTPGNWTPGGWAPGGWQPSAGVRNATAPVNAPGGGNAGGGYYNPSPRPGSGGGAPIIRDPGNGVRPHSAGIVGTAGGATEGINRGEMLPPQQAPNLGANNTTMPGMFSPTNVGNPNPLPSTRQILYDKLYRTLGG